MLDTRDTRDTETREALEAAQAQLTAQTQTQTNHIGHETSLDELLADFQRRTEAETAEKRGEQITSLHSRIQSILGRHLTGVLGVATAWVMERNRAIAAFTIDQEQWHIQSAGSQTIKIMAPDGAETFAFEGRHDTTDTVLAAITAWRERRRAQGISAYIAMPAVNPEPQVLIDQPGRSRIYILEAGTGCGSISQLALTVARLARDGSVEIGRLVPDTNDGEYVRMVSGPMMGRLMRIHTGWQAEMAEVAKSEPPNTPNTQAPEDPDLPF